MLERQLINEFRDLVNSNSHYIMHKFSDQEGRNRWSIICSAMDWITVAVNNINDASFDFDRRNIDEYCMKVFSYISMIDIILESVNQLHRVITSEQRAPFKGEAQFFSNNSSDDDSYFKHIRAVFGAHPVNLNPSNDNNDRWYASWPTVPHFGEFDFQAFLYPIDSTKEPITFGIYFEELKEYVLDRYLHLKTLSNYILEDYKNYIEKCKTDVIEYTGNEVQDLILAQTELSNRLPNDFMNQMIEDAILYLNTENSLEENRDVVDEFLSEVRRSVNDLKNAVQNLDFDQKDSYSIYDNYPYHEHHYEFSKYAEVLSGYYNPLEHHFFEIISHDLKPYVKLDESMSYKEIGLLIRAGLYKFSGE